METETYKKAKEILEKFDPETKKKIEEERKQKEIPAPVQSPDMGKFSISYFLEVANWLVQINLLV